MKLTVCSLTTVIWDSPIQNNPLFINNRILVVVD